MPTHKVDEAALTKGEARKLAALRKSLGNAIADQAFAKWRARQLSKGPAPDPNVQMMEDALNPLVNRLHFRTGTHYTVRRGRGRVIIKPIQDPKKRDRTKG